MIEILGVGIALGSGFKIVDAIDKYIKQASRRHKIASICKELEENQEWKRLYQYITRTLSTEELIENTDYVKEVAGFAGIKLHTVDEANVLQLPSGGIV